MVTGIGRVHGRPVAIMANDSTVKAGSWGARTVEKILRIQETAGRLRLPLFYLVDSAGARITDQIEMFPGRRHAGRIFHNQVQLSGAVPQICLLFGPSAAGGAYIPAFCDVVFMVDGNASMYLGSPRMAEMVIGEKVTLEEMGGARMHCEVSGCGDLLAADERACLARGARLPRPTCRRARASRRRRAGARAGRRPPSASTRSSRPTRTRPSTCAPSSTRSSTRAASSRSRSCSRASSSPGSRAWTGRAVGIVANQPKWKGGVLFVDSADKAARFIWLCDAFDIPLLFLADVPGFMIGKAVEQQGIIRHGAKMISAVATRPCRRSRVVVRKAYGAGLYAMCGPAFDPDATLALPQAMIAVMGAEAAVNAVFSNKIAEKPEAERAAYVEQLREEYRADIDLLKLAANLHVDAVVPGDDLRAELVRRLAAAEGKSVTGYARRRPVLPV